MFLWLKDIPDIVASYPILWGESSYGITGLKWARSTYNNWIIFFSFPKLIGDINIVWATCFSHCLPHCIVLDKSMFKQIGYKTFVAGRRASPAHSE